jgi:16S rRNA (adenine1518-N6/adenine1519-N6)-dimethyltransferase
VYVKPKKHLGQHFLRNDEICANIAAALKHPDTFNSILEIGPGTGALTRHLIGLHSKELFVAEVDHESIAWLHVHFPSLKGHILNEDVLRMPLPERITGQVAVIGNFPYNISSQILFWVLDHKDQVPEVVGMFQKEVAMRIAGGPGNKDYGILSVLVQAYYDAEYLFSVDEHEFDPPPKVKSGVIRLIRKTEQSLGCDEKEFIRVVKTAFNQRRKTMRNSLRSLVHDADLLTDPVFNKRPEQLSVAEFVELTKRIVSAHSRGSSRG